MKAHNLILKKPNSPSALSRDESSAKTTRKLRGLKQYVETIKGVLDRTHREETEFIVNLVRGGHNQFLASARLEQPRAKKQLVKARLWTIN